VTARSALRTRASGYLVPRDESAPELELADVSWACASFLGSYQNDWLLESVRSAPDAAAALRIVLDHKNAGHWGPEGRWDGMFNPRGLWVQRDGRQGFVSWKAVVAWARDRQLTLWPS
jgi:hypothetical protein